MIVGHKRKGIYQYSLIWAVVVAILHMICKLSRLQGTGQNCGLVSRNRPVSTGFYKGTLVSFLVLDVKKVRFVEVYFICLKHFQIQRRLRIRAGQRTVHSFRGSTATSNQMVSTLLMSIFDVIGRIKGPCLHSVISRDCYS